MNLGLKIQSATPRQLELDVKIPQLPPTYLSQNGDVGCKIWYVSNKIHGNHFSEKEMVELDCQLIRTEWRMRRGMERNSRNKSNNGQDEVLTILNSGSGNLSQLTPIVSC